MTNITRARDIYEKLKNEGEKAIDELILTRKSEEIFLDFKISSDNGRGKTLSQNDRNNLGKAVSGFGNSAGGVIIWGLQCSPDINGADVVDKKFLIEDAKKFLSLIEGAVSGVTLPPHQGIENYPIIASKEGEGFVVTYIPENPSLPLQSVHNTQFYIRAGSNFVPAPYQVLASMFGKRPQPHVFVRYVIGQASISGDSIHLQAGFMFHNLGPGIAQDLFLNADIMSSPGDNCQIGFDTPDTKNWTGGFSFGRIMSLISVPNFRLPPKGMAQPLILDLYLKPPFTDDLSISVIQGSANSAINESSLSSKKEVLSAIYDEYISSKKYSEIPKDKGHEVAMDILGRENSGTSEGNTPRTHSGDNEANQDND